MVTENLLTPLNSLRTLNHKIEYSEISLYGGNDCLMNSTVSNSTDISWQFWRRKGSKRCEHTNIASIRVCSDGRKSDGAAR